MKPGVHEFICRICMDDAGKNAPCYAKVSYCDHAPSSCFYDSTYSADWKKLRPAKKVHHVTPAVRNKKKVK